LQAPGAVCVSGDPSRRLIGYYQKLAAAKTEVRPFPTDAPAGMDAASAPPPLWDNLGKLHFAIGTKNPLAQRYFDQGLKLAYAFNHAEAARAFRQAQRLDPDCAMCHWGEALVLGPNINAPTDDAAGAHERELIAALARRYSGDAAAERGALDAAYAEAMGPVAARHPRDAAITLLYVEALMNLSPWDYWGWCGRIAQSAGEWAQARAEFEQAVALEDKLAYSEPPYWYYPVRQSLGAVLLAAGKPDEAETVFRQSLLRAPNNGWALHGLAATYQRLGKPGAGATARTQFTRAWVGAEAPDLARL